MAVTQIRPGRLHRALAPLDVVVHDWAPEVRRRERLEQHGLFQVWTPVEDDWRGVEVPITPGFGTREFSWGIFSTGGRFLGWNDFFERCELAGTVVPDGQVTALVAGGVGFAIDGEALDIDSGYGSRTTSAGLSLEHALLVGEVLATGETRFVEETLHGRGWRFTWTLEDQPEWPQPDDELAKRVWFFPPGEDWCALQLMVGSLISGLSAEARWLLGVLPPGTDRALVEQLLVSLDEAMVRCGVVTSG